MTGNHLMYTFGTMTLALSAALALLSLQGCAQSGNRPSPRFAVGQSIYNVQEKQETDPATGKAVTKQTAASEEVAQVLAREAVAEALKNYGPEQPKLVWVFDRTNLHDKVNAGVKEVLPPGVPCIIDGSYWPEYAPLGPKAVSDQKQQSLLAMALGQNMDVQWANLDIEPMTLKDWDIDKKYSADEAAKVRAKEQDRHKAWGVALAKKFDYTRPGQKVLIVMGTMHVPRHQWILDGINTVIAPDIHVVGGSQADFGWVVYNGQFRENTIYGILLTGDFKVAQAMQKASRDTDRPAAISAMLQSAKKELGGQPAVALYFGCAGWNKQNEGQYKALTEELPGIPFFGRFNGGELGRYKTDGPNAAGAGLASILLIK